MATFSRCSFWHSCWSSRSGSAFFMTAYCNQHCTRCTLSALRTFSVHPSNAAAAGVVRHGPAQRLRAVTLFGVRRASDSVVKASSEAKAAAKKDLDEVVSVIGYKPGDSDHEPEYNEAFFQKWTTFFDRPNIDSWEIRRGIHVLCDYDTVPDPTVIIAALKACRRLNDLALAIRFLEVVREKQGEEFDKINPWIEQEIGPTLQELGIPTLEELGYHVPELAEKEIDDIH